MEISKIFSIFFNFVQEGMNIIIAKFKGTHVLPRFYKMDEKFRASLKESGITDCTISTLIVQDILSKDNLSSLNDEEFKLLQGELTVGQAFFLRLYKNKVNELIPPNAQSGGKGKFL